MKRFTLAVALLLVPGVAGATYSIVATDQDTGQVGGAGASCTGEHSVYLIYGSAPGKGVIHAQAYTCFSCLDEAVRLLGLDTAPAEIIDVITDLNFDVDARMRQYGVVDLSGRAAGYTGAATILTYAADIQGTLGGFTYSVQGNTLTGNLVLEHAQEAFEGDGCDLAERLMLALEAGAAGGEGDNRCTWEGIPADSGFIHIDLADGTEYLHIDVTNSKPDSPLIEIRRQYDEWRLQNPCPRPPEAGEPDAGPADAGDGGSQTDDGGEPGGGGCGCTAGRSRFTLALLLLYTVVVGSLRRK